MPEYYLVTTISDFFQMPDLYLKYCRQDKRHGSPHWYNWVRPDRKKLGDDLCQRGLQGETVCLLAFKIWSFSLFALYIVISPSQVVLYDVDAGQVILKENLKVVKTSLSKVERALSNIKEELVEFEKAGTLRWFFLWWPFFFYSSYHFFYFGYQSSPFFVSGEPYPLQSRLNLSGLTTQ